MTATPNSTRQRIQPLARLLVLMLAFVLPIVAAVSIAQRGAWPQDATPAAFDGPLPAQPAHDPSKLTAVVLAGNINTESTDLLGPYEVLSASDAFNVYVVATERRPATLSPGGLEILPHYSLAEYDQTFSSDPDLIVVPAIATNNADAAVIDWLRAHAGARTAILSVCAGVRVVADAGLLAGRQATSNASILPFLEQTYPDVQWARGLRYVVDGQFISSAGVSSGVDATLYLIEQFLGREAAVETARRVGYGLTDYLDDRTWQVKNVGFASLLPYAFRSDRTDIGLVLYDGVGEIEVGSVVDTYPHAYGNVLTVAPERRVVRSRYGLEMIPRYDLRSIGSLDRLLIPGHPDAAVVGTIEQWAAQHELTAETIHAGGGYPYDLTLSDIARQETQPMAASVAREIEYPLDHLRLEGKQWPLGLLVRALVVILLGVALALAARRALQGWRQTQVLPTSNSLS